MTRRALVCPPKRIKESADFSDEVILESVAGQRNTEYFLHFWQTEASNSCSISNGLGTLNLSSEQNSNEFL